MKKMPLHCLSGLWGLPLCQAEGEHCGVSVDDMEWVGVLHMEIAPQVAWHARMVGSTHESVVHSHSNPLESHSGQVAHLLLPDTLVVPGSGCGSA